MVNHKFLIEIQVAPAYEFVWDNLILILINLGFIRKLLTQVLSPSLEHLLLRPLPPINPHL